VGVNPHRSEEKVKLLLNSSHLEPQVVKPQYHHRDDDFGVVEVLFPEKHQAPYLARQMSKWFCDTSTGAATGAACYGSFVGGGFGHLVASYG
jgi:hypothetical protein